MLSENLRVVRSYRGLSQLALAKKCGLRQEYVSALERGLRPSEADHVMRQAQALNVPADLLTGRPILQLDSPESAGAVHP